PTAPIWFPYLPSCVARRHARLIVKTSSGDARILSRRNEAKADQICRACHTTAGYSCSPRELDSEYVKQHPVLACLFARWNLVGSGRDCPREESATLVFACVCQLRHQFKQST